MLESKRFSRTWAMFRLRGKCLCCTRGDEAVPFRKESDCITHASSSSRAASRTLEDAREPLSTLMNASKSANAGRIVPILDTVGTLNSKSVTPRISSSPSSNGHLRIWRRRTSNDWSPVGRIVSTKDNLVLTTTNCGLVSSMSALKAWNENMFPECQLPSSRTVSRTSAVGWKAVIRSSRLNDHIASKNRHSCSAQRRSFSVRDCLAENEGSLSLSRMRSR
jgi:hypothetical protein